ncbi:MAG: PAS domain S-box protein [Balneolaceae bacterium]|nr:MAG: PAS domain S-box protein [Balneolaceae bacterium]
MNYLQKELYELVRGGDTILNFFQNVSLDGMWYWDLENPENEWMSESFWTTLGYDPAEMPHKMSAWKDIVNKEDLARVEKAIHKHLSDPYTRFNEIIRYKHKAGHTVWIRCVGMAIRDEEGKPVRMLGTHTDITKEIRKERFLEKCNAAANIGYWELDVENHELHWSNTTKKIHEVEQDYIPDLNTAIQFYEKGNFRKNITEAIDKLCNNGTSYDLELQLKTAKGRVIWVRTIGHAELFNGSCVRLYGSIQDIDEQKRSQIELQESNNRFEMLVENIPGATYQYIVTSNGKEKVFELEYMSSYIYKITGYTADEYSDNDKVNVKKLIHRDDVDEVISVVYSAIERQESWQIDYRIHHKDGSIKWVYEKGNVFSDSKKQNKRRLIGVLFDRTSEVESKIKRAEEKNLLRTIIDNVPVNIYLKDKHRRKILANPAEVKYSGYEKEEDVIGKTDEELYDGKIAKNYLPEDLKVLNEGVSLRELENDMGNGRWALVSKIPLKNEDGKVNAIVGITVDITERKVNEIKLKKSEEQFRKTFEYSANGMAIISMAGKYIQVNKAYEEILGYSNDELKNMNFRDISHPDDLKENDPLIEELVEGQRDYYIMDKRYIHKNGSYVWAHLAASLIKDEIGGKPYFISQITDITREKKAQQELNETLEKLKSILDASSRVAIISTDLNGLITSFNKGAENLLGYSAKEIVGKKTPLKFHLNEELHQRKIELFKNESVDVNGFEILKQFASKKKYITKEWIFVRKNGSRFPVQLTITEVKGAKGQLNGYLGIASDITELKRRENELEHLLEINKDQNERLLNFAHIVSHNLKGHAGNYSMIMELLKAEENPEEIKQFIDMLLTATENLNETVNNLNDIVETNVKTGEAKKQVNIKETLDMALGNLNAIANEAGAKVHFNVTEQEVVNAVPAYVDSIFHNFISNAIKYRSPVRKPVIHVSTDETEKYKVISFKDNGLGIDLNKAGNKLFEMFQTFHGNSDARGVGLFITKNQIESMGGHIEVESEVNKGTEFRVFFPK